MNRNDTPLTSRRQFLKATGGLAAMSALAGTSIPAVHAAGSDEIQVALVGCGGRGSGAAMDAMGTSKIGPINVKNLGDDASPAAELTFFVGTPTVDSVELFLTCKGVGKSSGNFVGGTTAAESPAHIRINRRRGRLGMQKRADRIEHDCLHTGRDHRVFLGEAVQGSFDRNFRSL